MCVQVSLDMMEGEPPLLWSAEEANLYILTLTLVDNKGRPVESESCQVGLGFRVR